MKPSINLKSFLAVLLILIVPAALLVAYFRDYSPEADGHEHSESGKSGATTPGGDASAGLGHGDMVPSPAGPARPPAGRAAEQTGAASALASTGRVLPPALPGFPGAEHLYHMGASDFFLDRPQHIVLTLAQQAALTQAREQARLAQRTADRAVAQAEQELWTLTGADQPDAAAIEGKIRAIEKLRGDERLAFICAIGDAGKLLTEEQRKSLAGYAPPVSTVPAPAAMAGGATTR